MIVRLRQLRAQLERARERALGRRVPLRDVRAIDLILGEHALEPAERRPRRREAIVGRGLSRYSERAAIHVCGWRASWLACR